MDTNTTPNVIKPFQFSIGGILIAIASLFVSTWSSSELIEHFHDPILQCLYRFLAFSAAGAGIGAIGGKTVKGAIWGVICGSMALLVQIWRF